MGAQQEAIRLQVYGFEEGLSHRNVFKVQQDTEGFLWAATAKGLNRFDGHQFLAWTDDDPSKRLPCDQVQDFLTGGTRLTLACGSDGNGSKLAFFTPTDNRFDTLRLDPASPLRQRERRYGNLCDDGKGGTWASVFAPADSSVWLQRADAKGLLREVARLPGHYPQRPITAAGGQVFVGAFENEIRVFDAGGRQLRQYELPVPKGVPHSFSRVRALQVQADGTLWALLSHGQVYFLRPGEDWFTRHPLTDFAFDHVEPSCFYVSPLGDVWMSGIAIEKGSGDGQPCSSLLPGVALLRYSEAKRNTSDLGYYLQRALSFTAAPRQMFADRTGVLWMATEFGLVKIVETNLFERYLADGNECCNDGQCSMRGMAEDGQGNIYFAYYNSLHVLTPHTGSLTPLFSPMPFNLSKPFGIVCHEGALWTGEGLRIDLTTLRTEAVLPPVDAAESIVVADRNGELWFGAGRKIFRVKNAGGRSTNRWQVSEWLDQSGSPEWARVQTLTFLFEDKNGSFWAGTREAGLFKLDRERQAVTQQFSTNTAPALPHERVTAIAEAGGHLWVGTSSGMARLHLANCQLPSANCQIHRYTAAEGLPNDFIDGILPEGDSAIWVSTDNGLARLDIAKGEFNNFFVTDGLSKNEFNRISAFRASDGRMYFGGLNGVNALHPNPRLASNPGKENGRLLLTEFSRFDGEHDHRLSCGLRQGEALRLSHRDKMFTFFFGLADFSDPKLHLYSYLLEGYDKEWSKPSLVNFARFFNIPAGDYLLRVRASRGGGDWVRDELAVPIHIRQAFWKTSAFRWLLMLLAVGTVFGVARYRVWLASQRSKELEAQVQARTGELASEKDKSERLLLNILPADTAHELKQQGFVRAKRYEQVTVMFVDFKEFTLIAAELSPEALVAELDQCFRAFDEIMEMYGIEKIKTVGDAYMAAVGLDECGTEGETEHGMDAAVRMVRAALEIQSYMKGISHEKIEEGKHGFEARIGLHTGPVVGGVVGIKKFAYDIWGDTVNIAARLQTNGEVWKVNISASTYELVKDHFRCSHRGKITAKHRGEVDMYFVEEDVA